jgi:multiple sugar transport system substrate-binding protein/putative spermidine/putrescine transport system substrate-binding protein
MTLLRWKQCAALLALACLAVAPGWAQVPLKNASFDTARLTRENFESTLAPIAKREGKLVLYNTAGNFDAAWKQGLIPRFEARYGVKVAYHNVRTNMAHQQLIAAHRAGVASPVDVYFAGTPESYALLRAAGAVADLDLAAVLPELATVPPAYARSPFGVPASGRWPIVHRNQTSLVYDSASLPTSQVPNDFDALLDWARRHPRQLALTSPAKGGSGGGFVYAAALRFSPDAACRTALQQRRSNDAEALRWAQETPCLEPLWAYMAALIKVSELTNGNADTLNLLNNRQVLIGTAWEDLVQTFVQAGQLPPSVRQTLLAPGMVSSGDGLIVPAHARSPAAALLFVNMAFGAEFQRWKLQHHASRSPRPDVDAELPPPQAATTMVPAAQRNLRSMDANWQMTQALAKVLEDKVLSKL